MRMVGAAFLFAGCPGSTAKEFRQTNTTQMEMEEWLKLPVCVPDLTYGRAMRTDAGFVPCRPAVLGDGLPLGDHPTSSSGPR